MKSVHRALLAAVLASGSPFAHAELTQAGAQSFLSTHEAPVPADPAAVFEALGQLPRWWNSQHTYSGDAKNLSIEMRAGGCFCEAWEGNSIEHARVIQVSRGKVLRLEGALGPLQGMAVAGVLHFAIAQKEGVTHLSMSYRVRGADASLEKIGPVVDRVMAEQFRRLVAFVGG